MEPEELANKVENLESDISNLKSDVAVVMTHVTNHIPHILAEHKEILESLSKRLQPVETQKIKMEAFSTICSIVLKSVLALGTCAWTIIQIINFLKK